VKSIVPKALVAIFIASMLPSYWIAFRAPAIGTYHDDGIYLVTAKALAEGKGYRILSLPGEPPQTKYPILFPAVLSVAWRMFPRFPENALFLKTIPFLSAILWLWLSYRMIKEETGARGVALGIVLLTAASSWVVYFSTTFMSETFFACVTTWALIRLKRLEGEDEEEKIAWPLLLSTALIAAIFLTRTIGAALVAASAVSLFLKRKYFQAVIILLGCAVLIGPWLWWQVVHGESARAIDSYYSVSNYGSWNILWNFTLGEKLHVLLINLLRIIFSPTALFNFGQNLVGLFISIIFTLLACSGFIRDFLKNIRTLHLFMFFYLVIIIFWVWPPERFLLPMVPFLLMFAYKEFSHVCGRVFKQGDVQTRISLVLVAILGVMMIKGLLPATRETMITQAVSVSFPNKQDDWKPIRELMDWVRKSTPKDSVLLGNLDPVYYLYTGRKAVRGFSADPYLLFYSGKPETALGGGPDLIRRIVAYRISYIVRTPSRFFMEGPIFNGILDGLLSDYPEAFHVVKVSSDRTSKIIEVDQGKLHEALRSGKLKARDGHGVGPPTVPESR
jgi:hypothetical protein